MPLPQIPLDDPRGYGYGWFAGGTGPARLVSHSGSADAQTPSE